MRILITHNYYQHRGGEDAVVESETELLRTKGHNVKIYTRNNNEILHSPSLSIALQTIWSNKTTRDIQDIINSFKPDIIHSHNTLPLISPSLYWLASKHRIPIIQTIHNFRLFCLNGLFLKDGKVCEKCLGHTPWRGVAHSCYRDSRSASTVLASMTAIHRSFGTYQNKISQYIALNNFCRAKLIAGGIPSNRISIKPNFVDIPPPEPQNREGFLFVGRLSQEKGISTLSDAVRKKPNTLLRVAGEGPHASLLDNLEGVTHLGSLNTNQVRDEMSRATALITPSIWYENFPRTIVEAFASSLPVIASRIGALEEIVTHGETGLLFNPGDPNDLLQKINWALEHPIEMVEMGLNARKQYESKFTPDTNYNELIKIYSRALAEYDKTHD